MRRLDDLTLVIPTLGRDILRECLRSIQQGDAWPARVILVHQGSNPEVARWAASLREAGLEVEHVPSPRLGRAAGVNRGVERVRTRYVAVTDDDCLVEPDWASRMVERLRSTPGALVTGRVEPEGEEEVVAVMTSRVPATYRRPRLKHDSLCGGNMGAATEVLARIGPFDEDPCLATAEDCEYSYRALRGGVPIVYDPTVAVRHVGWRSEDQREAQYKLYGRSVAGFFGKYLRRGDWFVGLRAMVHLLRTGRRWLRGVVSRDRDLALNGRAYVTQFLPGFRDGWRRGRPR